MSDLFSGLVEPIRHPQKGARTLELKRAPGAVVRRDSNHQPAALVNRMTKQMMRQSNIVKPTSDDTRIAKNRAEMAIKRADLEYQRKIDGIG